MPDVPDVSDLPDLPDSDSVSSDDSANDSANGSARDSAAEAPARTSRARTLRWARRPNTKRAGALIGVLLAGLGFAIAVQVHANSSSDNLSNLRADDLIGILDNQTARADQLRSQIASLQDTLRRLRDSGDRSSAAEQQAQQELSALSILLGTIPATGPGVRVTVEDPDAKLGPEDLLDVVEELRGAGAEAIQFGPIRVSTSTALTGSPGAVRVDGVAVSAPYVVLAIGDSASLETALNIPGGVAATLRTAGGSLSVTQQPTVAITAVRTPPTPRYATPVGH